MELLDQVAHALKSGQLKDAEAIASEAMANNPNDWRTIYANALVQFQLGDYEQALTHFQAVRSLSPTFKPNMANLGMTLHRLKRLDEAEQVLREALQLAPDHFDLNLTLALVLRDTQRTDDALEIIETLYQHHAPTAELEAVLGDLLRIKGRWPAAGKAYRRAVKLNPDYHAANIHLAFIALSLGRLEEARRHCQSVLDRAPDHLPANSMLGRVYTAQEKFDEAMDCFADAYDESQPDADLCAHIGEVWALKGDHQEATQWFMKAIGLNKDQYDAVVGMANLIKDMDDAPAALAFLDQRDDNETDVPTTYLLLRSDLLWEEGDTAGAIGYLETAKEREPHRAAIHVRIGKIHSSAGDVSAAEAAYRQALTENPDCVPAINGLATLQKKGLEPDLLAKTQALYSRGNRRHESMATLANSLSYHYDSTGDYEKAAAMMREANELQWAYRHNRDWNYTTEGFESYCQATMDTFDANYMETLASDAAENSNEDEFRPVFVVSMPRSGTTLTEQILARHPNVLGIGERNFANRSLAQARAMSAPSPNPYGFLSSLGNDALAEIRTGYRALLDDLISRQGNPHVTRVVDKMPDNYNNIGWILTLFPNAAIVHVQRDPRDVALSCWHTQFASINWACKTEHLVHRIHGYQKMMAHWRTVAPGRFLEIDYETLVSEQERVSRQMIDWIGLDWDDACLEFYSSDRLVRTASITQVRKPMYKSSVAKWERYKDLIPDLFEPLSPVSRPSLDR